MADVADKCDHDHDDDDNEEAAPSLTERTESLQEIISADIDQVFDEVPVTQAGPAVYVIAVKLMAEYLAYMQLHGMPENIGKLTSAAAEAGFRTAMTAMGITAQNRQMYDRGIELGLMYAEDIAKAAKALAVVGR